MSGSVASAAYAGPPTINGVTEVDADVLVITEGGTLSYPDYPNTVLVVQSDGTVVGVSEIDQTQVPTTLRSTTFPSLVVVGGIAAASATVGTLTVTGVATIGTLSTTSLALSGTLSVAGATTLAACSAASLSVSGTGSFGGVLSASGGIITTSLNGSYMDVGYIYTDVLEVGASAALGVTSTTTFTATGPATMAAVTCSSLTTSGQIFSNYAASSQMVFTPGTAASTFIRVEGPAGGVNRRITFADPGTADREVLYTNKAQPATLGSTIFSGGAVQVQIPGDGTASATQELWFGQDSAGETQWRLLGANSTFGSNWRIRQRVGGVTSDKLIVQASGTSIWSHLGVGKAPTANALDVLGATLLQGLTCTTLSCTTLTTSSDGVIGGNLTVTGSITLAAVTMGSLNCTGNATIGGTLGVTGSATFSNNVSVTGTLNVFGPTVLAGLTSSGISCTTLTAAGNVGITGTLSASGNTTLSANVGIGSSPNASYRLYVTGNPTNLTRSAIVPSSAMRVLNVADSNTVAWVQNGDPTDSGRIMQVYNGSSSTSAGIQAVQSFHIIGAATASRVLSDLKMIRETAGQGNGAFVLTGRTNAATIVMRDYAYLGWSKAYISPGAGNPVTLASQTAPTAGYYVAMGTAGGTTDGHTEVNGNLLVRGTATVSGATSLASVSASGKLEQLFGGSTDKGYEVSFTNTNVTSATGFYLHISQEALSGSFGTTDPFSYDLDVAITSQWYSGGSWHFGTRYISGKFLIVPWQDPNTLGLWTSRFQASSSSPNTTDDGSSAFGGSVSWTGSTSYLTGPVRVYTSLNLGLTAGYTYTVRAHIRGMGPVATMGPLSLFLYTTA